MFNTRHDLSIGLLLQGRRHWSAIALMAIVTCGLAVAGNGAALAGQASTTLAAGTASGMAGTNVDLAIDFSPASSSVSTMQFDLRFPASLGYISSVTGTAAATAQKSVYLSTTTGGASVLVYGVNNNVIGSGTIVVVTLLIAAGTPVSTIPVTVQNIVASTPTAASVAVSAVNGSVNVLAPGDTTPPVISNIVRSNLSSSGVSITWTTNEASDSQVQYGATSAYGNITVLDATLVTAHSQTLSGLTPNTLYHYSVMSTDVAGNVAVSADATFTTAPEQKAPSISNVAVSRVSTQTASITWNTDVPADTGVVYGTSPNFGASKNSAKLTTLHNQSLTGLKPSTVYYYRARSKSASGLLSESDVRSFQTAASKKTRAASSQSAKRAADGSDPVESSDEESATYCGVVVTNFGDTPAELTFTAHRRYATEGTEADKAQRTLAPRAQLVLMDFELFGEWVREPGVLDWIEVSSSSRDVAGFTVAFDAGLTMLDHTQLPPATLTGFLFTELGESDSTSIHINNPNASPAHLTFQLIQSDGQLRASAQRGLEPGGALKESVSTLFPDIVVEGTDYMRITSDMGVTPFERFRMNSQDTAGFSGLDVNGGATTLFSPHYVAGGDYQAILSITNLEGRDGMLELRLYGDNGLQIGPTKNVPVAGYGKVDISDPSFFAATETGPIQGYVQISGGGLRVTGHMVFGDSVSGTALAALPLADRARNELIVSHVASNEVSFTELALLNPNDSVASATVNLYQADGRLDGSATVTLGPRQRVMQRLTQLFPHLIGQDRSSGYLEVLTDQGVIGFSLLGTNDLRSMDAIQAQPIQGRQRLEEKEEPSPTGSVRNPKR